MTARQLLKVTVRLNEGNTVKISYHKEGEIAHALGQIIPYHRTAQGKRAIAAKGFIGKSNYLPTNIPGIVKLKSNPEKLYLEYTKRLRDESGRFVSGDGRRNLSLEKLVSLEILEN